MNAATGTAVVIRSAAYDSMSTCELKEDIIKENAKAISTAKKSLEHVRNCGEMLIALKEKAGHGQWKFAPMELKMSQKTISNYMRIASNWQRVAVLDRGLKDALKVLAREESPPSKPSPTSSSVRTSSPPAVIEAEAKPPASSTPKDALPLGATYEEAEIVELEPGNASLTTAETDRLAELEATIENKLEDAFGTILELFALLPKSKRAELLTILTNRWS